MGNFRKLIVWQRAKDLAIYIYKITANQSFEKDRGLQGQMRRASVSIPSNIAEGDESGFNKLTIRYFKASKGSAAELITQTIIAYAIRFLTINEHNYIVSECEEISRMLYSLIEKRASNLKPQTSNLKPQTLNPRPIYHEIH